MSILELLRAISRGEAGDISLELAILELRNHPDFRRERLTRYHFETIADYRAIRRVERYLNHRIHAERWRRIQAWRQLREFYSNCQIADALEFLRADPPARTFPLDFILILQSSMPEILSQLEVRQTERLIEGGRTAAAELGSELELCIGRIQSKRPRVA